MGTSASQPSPRGAGWRAVRRAYIEPDVAPPAAVTRIVQAMDKDFIAGLSGAPVARVLRSLLAHSSEVVVASGDQAQLVAVACSLREEVVETTAARRDASRFGEIALAAATQTVLASSRRPPGMPLARAFLGTYLAHLFAHIVGRDISRYVGRGRFTSIAEAGEFVHATEAHVVEEVNALTLAELEVAEEEEEIAQLLSDVVPRALEHLVREEGEDAG